MVLYVFAFDGYFKLGYTAHCPYGRLAMGFWHCVHPPELCGRLGECALTHLFDGDEAIERALHAALIPDCGEFYKACRLEEVLGLVRLTLTQLPLPPHQKIATTPNPLQLRPCCGGSHRGYGRDDHKRRAAATKGKSVACPTCGKSVSCRNDKLKQHQRSSACRPTSDNV